ncbi:MAG: 30S ribosomal protein S2 [candidate division BRC1 bacterium ADurb.BinA364]|nr:MAG: 30S ribosomal protein S2 [candidate division BRC1 bacterium ADurb.BinA364]
MQQVSMKQFLESGVHFGHQSRRWNPKMKKYIYTERNGIYIIDLKKTLKLLREATTFVRDTVANGGMVLFIGTKKQAKEAVEKWAAQCNMYYVSNRWLGGMLTNFKTVRRSVLRLLELERMVADGTMQLYSKKEQAQLQREREGLEKNLSGVKTMSDLPAAIFVIDPHREQIAVREANKLGIPVVSLVDTNCDPDPIDYVIPGNDDAIRSVNLMCQKIAEACQEGFMARLESGLSVPEGTELMLQEQGLTIADREERYAVYRDDEADEEVDYGVKLPKSLSEEETPEPVEVDPMLLQTIMAGGASMSLKTPIVQPRQMESEPAAGEPSTGEPATE